MTVTAVALIELPPPGLKAQVDSDGSPVQLYVSGNSVVELLATTNPFVPFTTSET